MIIPSFSCFIVPMISEALEATLNTNPTIDHKLTWIISIIPDKAILQTAIHTHPLSSGIQQHSLLKNFMFIEPIFFLQGGVCKPFQNRILALFNAMNTGYSTRVLKKMVMMKYSLNSSNRLSSFYQKQKVSNDECVVFDVMCFSVGEEL